MQITVSPSGTAFGVTLGVGPNGSQVSLSTAPVVSATQSGDLLLVNRGGQLVQALPGTVLGDSVSFTSLDGGSLP